jgi:GNAT superfamily N-acetyltransferase
MELNIRAVQPKDASMVAMLSGHFGYPATTEEMEARLQMLFASSTDWAWVAEENGQILGWIQATSMLRLERGVFLEITGLVVHESQRSRGIGRQLVLHAADFGKLKGFERLVVRSNVVRLRTHEFYLKLGFTNSKDQKVFEVNLR